MKKITKEDSKRKAELTALLKTAKEKLEAAVKRLQRSY